MRQHLVPRPRSWSTSKLVWLALGCALLGCGAAAAQSSLAWGIEEKASRGCVEDVSLEFHAIGALGGHPPQSLCGSTPVRMYPEPLPTGMLTVSFRNQRGERRHYEIPLDAVFRRDNVHMQQAVIELFYGQDSLEVWVRPLARSMADARGTASAPDGELVPKRLFFGGLELDAAPPPPGISRSR